jgi:hypothetical protein
MKRLRCKATLFALFVAGGGSTLDAQGSAFLLRPVGARAVGLGQAVAARRDGSEGMWWNPASLVGSTMREVSIHHSQDFFATGDALTLVVPTTRIGVFALAADLQNYGEQENTTDPSVPATGTVLTRSFVLAGSYASSIGSRTTTGITVKLAQMRVDCTGPCDFPNEVAQTVAVDAGAQLALGRSRRVMLGASVRNMGLALETQDSDESEPLPTRFQVGMLYRYPMPARYADEAELNLSTDLTGGRNVDRPQARVGAEFVFQKRAFLRGGYVFDAAESDAGGPTLGLGFSRNNLVLDLARVFSGFSADAGQAPTFLSLRLRF